MTGGSGSVAQGCPWLSGPADGWDVLDRLATVTEMMLQPRVDSRAALGELLDVATHLLTDDWAVVTWPLPGQPAGLLARIHGGELTSDRADLPSALVAELDRPGAPSRVDSAGWTRTALTADGRDLGALVLPARSSPGNANSRYDVVLRALARHCSLVLRASVPAFAVNDPLTDREGEVLQLLARGSSNREIARSLFVSESTAKFHVANVMRKLDVTRRAQVAYVTGGPGPAGGLESRDSA